MKQFQRVIWASLLCLPMAMSAQAASGVIGSGVAGTTQDTQGITSASNASNTSGASNYGGAVNNAFKQETAKASQPLDTTEAAPAASPLAATQNAMNALQNRANAVSSTEFHFSDPDSPVSPQPQSTVEAKQTALLKVAVAQKALAALNATGATEVTPEVEKAMADATQAVDNAEATAKVHDTDWLYGERGEDGVFNFESMK